MRVFSEFTGSVDNNFNVVRLVAAAMVFISHSYALATGRPDLEPLFGSIGMSLGTLAVHIFFVASGFLVTGSLMARLDLREFLLSRALRVLPGLWCSLFVTLLICGWVFTNRPALDFFTDGKSIRYLLYNATVVLGTVCDLPGTFEGNAYPMAANGSLWTLPYEVRLYGGLAALAWLTRRFMGTRTSIKWLCLVLAIALLVAVEMAVAGGRDAKVLALTYLFFAGSSIRYFQAHVRASAAMAGLVALGLVISAGYDATVFKTLYFVSVPWLVIWVCLVPRGPWRSIGHTHDYSYGIYIYAFPIQQMFSAVVPHRSPETMMLACALPLALAAALSWHLVEKPVLKQKGRVMHKLRNNAASTHSRAATPRPGVDWSYGRPI